jgi:hypothetical protein
MAGGEPFFNPIRGRQREAASMGMDLSSAFILG